MRRKGYGTSCMTDLLKLTSSASSRRNFSRVGMQQWCLCQEDTGIKFSILSSLIRQSRLSVTEVLGEMESNAQGGRETERAQESRSYWVFPRSLLWAAIKYFDSAHKSLQSRSHRSLLWTQLQPVHLWKSVLQENIVCGCVSLHKSLGGPNLFHLKRWKCRLCRLGSVI